MRTILTISQDERLLVTRAAVLRRTKAEVIAATASEAKKILKAQKFDLVVLCHSLSIQETLEIAALAHQQTIAIPVLKVVANEPVSEWRLIGPDLTAPGMLVERAAQLLSVSQSGTN